MSSWRPAHTAFLSICGVCEIALFVYDRTSAYIALGAFAYGLILWLIARACIQTDEASEESVLKTTARGWRLACRVLVVLATFAFLLFGHDWFWNSPANAVLQRFFAPASLGNGDSAIPNFLTYALIPGALLFLLGAKPIELGLTSWRKGAWSALLGALVLPAIFIGLWFSKGHGSAGLLLTYLAHNFLSNGFSEEFLMRAMTLSHLRAFVPKEWAVVIQAILFGLFHLAPLGRRDVNWFLETAADIAMNAPVGFFLALIALRARSVLLPGLIHTSLDTIIDVTR
jgi:membrane protease YdiL (CAAX protease family)